MLINKPNYIERHIDAKIDSLQNLMTKLDNLKMDTQTSDKALNKKEEELKLIDIKEEDSNINTDNILLNSGAWPKKSYIYKHEYGRTIGENVIITPKSDIHALIKDNKIDLKTAKIYYSKLKSHHIDEIRKLHLEWFPLEYGESFYKKLQNTQKMYTLGCFVDDSSTNKTYILGTILIKFQNNKDIINKTVGRNWFWTCERTQNAYIMTLGVIDEARRFGIGTRLLQKALDDIENTKKTCKVINLHVVDYNDSAIKFYEKNNFKLLHKVKDHYFIKGTVYDALIYYYVCKRQTEVKREGMYTRIYNKLTSVWKKDDLRISSV